MMGLGVPRGYLVVLEDGRNFKVHEYEADEEIISSIISITEDFWKRVLLGRQAVERGEDYDQFAPPPDGTEAYSEYLNERFANPEDKTIVSTPDIDDHIRYYLELNGKITNLEEEKREQANFIKTYMGNYSMINSDVAKVTWRPNKNGSRVFRVS